MSLLFLENKLRRQLKSSLIQKQNLLRINNADNIILEDIYLQQ